MIPETNDETKKEQKCLTLRNRLITVIMKMIMIKDNDNANGSYIQYADSFHSMCSFVSRHLDNNQLENLNSGIFDQQSNLYEL